MRTRIRLTLLLSLLLCLLLLAGCTKQVALSCEKVEETVTELTAVVTPEDLPLLDQLPDLKTADFSGSTCYEEILAWASAHPGVDVRYTVALPDGTAVANDAKTLDLSAYTSQQQEDILPLLPFLPALRQVQLGSDPVPAERLGRFQAALPDAEIQARLTLGGNTISADETWLQLHGLNAKGVKDLSELLPVLTKLSQVDLGDQETSPDLTWKQLASLQDLRPDVAFSFGFTLYDRSFNTTDTVMDLKDAYVYDQGSDVRQVLPCMRNLEMLDMEHCDVPNETLGQIQAEYPDVVVAWRVYFGDLFSCRTDAIKILASNPGVGGNLTPENTEVLKYCTRIKYLDVGHNSMLTDISFVRYMPDLEVAILAMDDWTDASPLADCPKLEFLEIQTTLVSDLTPLANLTNLRHLNICYDFELTDITPIYGLDLQRLWIGCLTPIPQEQVDEYRRLHPRCRVDTDAYDPHSGWRWIGTDPKDGSPVRDPRYNLLVDQFGYDRGEYSYEWIDNRGW
ncbi:MAG: hypothetical protein J5927_00475 [Oscillospiraceae bacterium]|nr:hypothetical protein [Oscillospiraceae bacterium]